MKCGIAHRGACVLYYSRMAVYDILTHVDGLLAKKEDQKLRSFLSRQSTTDLAHVIDQLPHGKRKTFAILPPEMQADVAVLLSNRSHEFILPRLSDHAIARFLHFCDEDDAVDLLHEVPEERRASIVSHLKEDKRYKVQKLLTFGSETAGGLMDLNFIVVDDTATIKDVSDMLREHLKLHRKSPMVVVRDARGRTIGFVPYRTLMFSSSSKPIGDIAIPIPLTSSKADQENVLKLATREKSDVIGVQDEGGHIIGIIQLHDLLRVAQTEATEDVYKFAGVSPEESAMDSPLTAVRRRYGWLVINLGTAFMASFVVSLFQDTIAALAILAAYMPIVAGMGGNAGTQSLAIVVRGIALGEIPRHQRMRLVVKEMSVGLINGFLNGVIVAIVVYALRGTLLIGVVLGVSMVINMVVAGLFGAVVPIVLRAFKIDPAIASTVFVTTATDISGFFTFLGLATLVLR